MEYKHLVIDKLKDYMDELGEYSITEMLYSVFSDVKKGNPYVRKGEIKNMTDKMLYQALCRSLEREKEVEYFKKKSK